VQDFHIEDAKICFLIDSRALCVIVHLADNFQYGVNMVSRFM